MRTTLPLLITGLCLSVMTPACKNKESVVESTNVVEEVPAATPDRYGGPTPADSLFFSLERTPCFGQCKAYRIRIYRSGYAIYEGSSFVEKVGTFEGRVSADTMALLLRKAEEVQFFGMQDKYDSQVTDLPSTIIRLVANANDKKVIGRVGTPAAFKALAAYADELVFPLPWMPHAPTE